MRLAVDQQQRLVVQRGEPSSVSYSSAVGGDARGGREVQPPANTARRRKSRVRERQQVVAPLHRRLQRLVPRHRAAAAGEEAEAIVDVELGHDEPRVVDEQTHRLRVSHLVDVVDAGSESDRTANTCSPGIPSASRLVAMTFNAPHPESSASIDSTAASITCSQLSSTTSVRRDFR